jgi:hypothetical protein
MMRAIRESSVLTQDWRLRVVRKLLDPNRLPLTTEAQLGLASNAKVVLRSTRRSIKSLHLAAKFGHGGAASGSNLHQRGWRVDHDLFQVSAAGTASP